ILEDNHARAFAEHKSSPRAIEGATGELRVVIAVGRQCSHRGKAGDEKRVVGQFNRATDHQRRSTKLDRMKGVADRLGAGRACGDNRRAWTAKIESRLNR